ncbi:hypothetical protein BJ166DRAFT_502293 [Pestalotiopsis sp. NC0098]|nr:hypothetical protein BJ166DRAFT_502293 [Pestalotiopsis sp. NC0098]
MNCPITAALRTGLLATVGSTWTDFPCWRQLPTCAQATKGLYTRVPTESPRERSAGSGGSGYGLGLGLDEAISDHMSGEPTTALPITSRPPLDMVPPLRALFLCKSLL